MMKGWIDRVWSYGWAYDQTEDPQKSLLPRKKGMLLVPAGASEERLETSGQKAAMETIWAGGTFGYFGLDPLEIEFLCGATGSTTRRQALLQRCFDLGATI